jgi:trimeric autotransporter adhesin
MQCAVRGNRGMRRRLRQLRCGCGCGRVRRGQPGVEWGCGAWRRRCDDDSCQAETSADDRLCGSRLTAGAHVSPSSNGVGGGQRGTLSRRQTTRAADHYPAMWTRRQTLASSMIIEDVRGHPGCGSRRLMRGGSGRMGCARWDGQMPSLLRTSQRAAAAAAFSSAASAVAASVLAMRTTLSRLRALRTSTTTRAGRTPTAAATTARNSSFAAPSTGGAPIYTFADAENSARRAAQHRTWTTNAPSSTPTMRLCLAPGRAHTRTTASSPSLVIHCAPVPAAAVAAAVPGAAAAAVATVAATAAAAATAVARPMIGTPIRTVTSYDVITLSLWLPWFRRATSKLDCLPFSSVRSLAHVGAGCRALCVRAWGWLVVGPGQRPSSDGMSARQLAAVWDSGTIPPPSSAASASASGMSSSSSGGGGGSSGSRSGTGLDDVRDEGSLMRSRPWSTEEIAALSVDESLDDWQRTAVLLRAAHPLQRQCALSSLARLLSAAPAAPGSPSPVLDSIITTVVRIARDDPRSATTIVPALVAAVGQRALRQAVRFRRD